MSRPSFRARPIDVNQSLAIVREELDPDQVVAREVTHGHQTLDAENEEVRARSGAPGVTSADCCLYKKSVSPVWANSVGIWEMQTYLENLVQKPTRVVFLNASSFLPFSNSGIHRLTIQNLPPLHRS